MFDRYTMAIGEHVVSVLNTNGIHIHHVKDCYEYWGLNKGKFDNLMNDSLSGTPCLIVDLEFSFLSNYTMTKYYTESDDGMMHFWEFDYKTNFPASCRPSIIMRNISSVEKEQIERILEECYGKVNVVRIKHPILNASIVLNLQIDENTSCESGLVNTKYMKLINVPWFIGQILEEDFKINKNCNLFVMKQIEALTIICDTCEKKMVLRQNAETNDDVRIKEKVQLIDSNRIKLLNFAKIPEDKWSLNSILWIYKRMIKEECTIAQIISKMREEEEKAKEEKKQEELEKEKLRQEKMRRQHRMTYDEYSESQRRSEYPEGNSSEVADEIRRQTREMEKLERERIKREQEYENEERHRRARESQRQFDAVVKANQERRRKGQPELPLPPREYW